MDELNWRDFYWRITEKTNMIPAILSRVEWDEKRIETLMADVAALKEADRIAEAVSSAIQEKDDAKSSAEKLGLSKRQYKWGIIIGLASVAGNFAGLIYAIIHVTFL